MLKAYQYRLYPNKQQKELFDKHFGHVRHVYNWALSEKKSHFETHGKNYKLNVRKKQQFMADNKNKRREKEKEREKKLLTFCFFLKLRENKYLD
jgi:transposase